MRSRCSSAVTITTASLLNHKLAFTRFAPSRGGGVADIPPSEGDRVEGVIYEIGDDDAFRLDEFEGVAEECYERKQLRLTLPAGEIIEAFAYKAIEQGEFAPSTAYIGHLISGAKYHGLSPEYIAMLEAIKTAD
ncbi:gamma-glutamylcyclotransferase [bacterium]|nr:gamma-glutamylcyclotransferase [bacterium]